MSMFAYELSIEERSRLKIAHSKAKWATQLDDHNQTKKSSTTDQQQQQVSANGLRPSDLQSIPKLRSLEKLYVWINQFVELLETLEVTGKRFCSILKVGLNSFYDVYAGSPITNYVMS